MDQRVENWKKLKFGMFIHWGLYSVQGKGEWCMFNEPVDKAEYAKLAQEFTAEKFDAEQWVQLARAAGMKYMVFTTKHHDGFSLWDSKASVGDFTSIHSAAKRDFVKEYVEACRKHDMKVGLYYSPADWRFEGFFLPRMYRQSALDMKEQCHSQVRELLTDYGKIDILWFDAGEDYILAHGTNVHDLACPRPEDFREHPQIKNFWEADKLNEEIRRLQPEIIVNNRTGERQFGDYGTPERRVGEFNLETPWETADTLAESWGWMPDRRLRSVRNVITLLVRVVTGGGNLLLNVGPMGDGSFEPAYVERLLKIGSWLKQYGEAIYDTQAGPMANGEWGGYTWRDNRLYIHVLDWESECVLLPRLQEAKIEKIYSLTAEEIQVKERDNVIELSVSDRHKNDIDTIFVVEYDRDVDQAFCNFNEKGFLEKKHYQCDALIVEQM